MTKKTNSLILRFGISNLWYNRGLSNANNLITIQLEYIVWRELKKKKLCLLKFEYTLKRLYIDVYNIIKLDDLFQKQLIYHYFVYDKPMKYLMYKFGVRIRDLVWIFRRRYGRKVFFAFVYRFTTSLVENYIFV